MIDEILFGGIALLNLVTLFYTRRYMQRLDEVSSEVKKTRKEMKSFRKWYKNNFEIIEEEKQKND